MIRSIVAATTLLFCLSAQAEISEYYQVNLLTENYPPYNMSATGKQFSTEDGIKGIAADVVREIFKRAQIKYTMTLLYPWNRIYQRALEKANYGIFVTARTPERQDLFKWVGPIGTVERVMLARSNSPITLSNLEDAKQYKVGAYKGAAAAEELIKNGFSPNLELHDQENAKRLMEGKIDLWATGEPIGRYLAGQIQITDLKTVLSYSKSELYLALNKQTPDEVVSKLQAALDQMREEGRLQEINKQYL